MGEGKRADPDLKQGFLRIADELALALAKTAFSPKQGRCVWYLIYQTYGWKDKGQGKYGRKWAEITTQMWVEGTGLQKPHVYKALRELQDRNVVTRNGHQYGLQTDYTRWREVTGTGHRRSGDGKWSPISNQNRSPNGNQNRSLLYKERNHKSKSKRCTSCQELFEPREEWMDKCDSCFKSAKNDSRYTGYVECSRPGCNLTGPPGNMRLDDQGVCYYCRMKEGGDE